MPDGSLAPRGADPVFVPGQLRQTAGFTTGGLPLPEPRRYRPVTLTGMAFLPEAAPSAGNAGEAARAVAAVLSGSTTLAVAAQAGVAEEPAPDLAVPPPSSVGAEPPAEAQPALPCAQDLLQEAWSKGRAEAEAELAGKQAEVASAARALGAALVALARPAAAATDALAASLEAAVRRLAAQRAGQAIDASPMPFARRIAQLAGRVAQHQGMVRVHLHPDDLAVIAPLVAAGLPDLADMASARLVPDTALARGDADLRAPGVRLADLLDGIGDTA